MPTRYSNKENHSTISKSVSMSPDFGKKMIFFGVHKIVSKVSGEAFLGKYAKQSPWGQIQYCKHDMIAILFEANPRGFSR